MKSKSIALAAGLVFALSMPVSVASAGEGFYVSGHAGIAVAGSSDSSFRVAGATGFKADTSYDYGLGGGAAVGYSFPQAHSLGGFRVEGEFDFFRANPDDADLNFGLKNVKVSGSVNQYSFFANGYRDFDELKDVIPSVTPYLGLGVGFSIVDANGIALPGGAKFSDSDVVFAGQVIAGLSYDIMPKLVLSGNYRFIMTSDPHIKKKNVFGPGGNATIRSDNYRHVFGFSLRYYIN